MAFSHHYHHQLRILHPVDYFDLLPDPILLSIFNKILDSKSLTRCLAVSKRFASLIPQIDSLSITIPSPHHHHDPLRTSSTKPTDLAKLLFLLRNLVTRPFRSLHRIILNKSSSSDLGRSFWKSEVNGAVDVHRWNNLHLKNFSSVRSLHLKLPCHGDEPANHHHHRFPIVRWRAEFGKEMRRCVIAAANSIQKGEIAGAGAGDREDSVMSNEELKSRILTVISCLLAASARHCLVKRMMVECPELREVVIGDARRQGKMTMMEEDVGELRSWIASSSCVGSGNDHVVWQRTCLPDLVIKMWYAEELELPESGDVLRGAMIAVVRPAAVAQGADGVGGWGLEGCLGWGDEEEEGGMEVFGESVVREIMRMKRKKVCKLEMSSF